MADTGELGKLIENVIVGGAEDWISISPKEPLSDVSIEDFAYALADACSRQLGVYAAVSRELVSPYSLIISENPRTTDPHRLTYSPPQYILSMDPSNNGRYFLLVKVVGNKGGLFSALAEMKKKP